MSDKAIMIVDHEPALAKLLWTDQSFPRGKLRS